MKIFKRIVSVLMSVSTLMVGSFTLSTQVNAEVYTPEIVKTETWTTTYYIDEDKGATYPLECEADIYNDGSIRIYFWSGYEWSGFRTVEHTVNIVPTIPYSTISAEYCLKNGIKYTSTDRYPKGEWTLVDAGILRQCDLSYYSDKYSYNNEWAKWGGTKLSTKMSNEIYTFKGYSWGTEITSTGHVHFYTWSGYLVDFPTTKQDRWRINLIPAIEPTDTYSFRILGHDIVITPELLSTTTYKEPIDETEAMIHELESQINDLNTELEQLRAEKEVWEQNETHLLEDIELLYKENEVLVARRGDINDDGLFTVADAVLLMRYVAGTIDTIPYKKIN